MAFDLFHGQQMPVQSPATDLVEQLRVIAPHRPYKAPTKWRQSVFGIINDSLGQLDENRSEEDDQIWRWEARQRALNFAELGLSEIGHPVGSNGRRAHQQWDLSAIAVLGGAYRVLAKCDGHKPVQCENLLRTLLTNMALAYAPACGKIEVDLKLCALILPPIKCRALILAVGMLVQATIRHAASMKAGGSLKVALSATTSEHYSLALRWKGRQADLARSPELDLAARLIGLLQSELRYSIAENNQIEVLFTFPGSKSSEPSINL